MCYMHNAVAFQWFISGMSRLITYTEGGSFNCVDTCEYIEYRRYVKLYRAVLDQILQDLKNRSARRCQHIEKIKVRRYIRANKQEIKHICHLADIEYNNFMRIVEIIIRYNI